MDRITDRRGSWVLQRRAYPALDGSLGRLLEDRRFTVEGW